MPTRQMNKNDEAESYYHIYVQGNNRQDIFIEDADYYYFEKLFARYLSPKVTITRFGLIYPHYAKRIELLSYCLMDNHLHLLVYQIDQGTMAKLLNAIMTSYSRYFNLKYRRRGRLFEGHYKAVKINSQQYFDYVSRGIHLKPHQWRTYPYSSLRHYLNETSPEWLKVNRVLSVFTSPLAYLAFLKNYESYQGALAEAKREMVEK